MKRRMIERLLDDFIWLKEREREREIAGTWLFLTFV